MPPKVNIPPGGRQIVAEGLPEGWMAVQRRYSSGTLAGQSYTRYANGRHSNIASRREVIKLDARDRNLDVRAELQKFEAQMQDKKEKQVRSKAARGLVEGARREEALAAFRQQFGKLDGATIAALPGWRSETKMLEKCGQLSTKFISPEGVVYPLVWQVEAMFGLRLLECLDIPDIVHAQRISARMAERRDPRRRAVRHSERPMALPLTDTPVLARKRRRVAGPQDYRESPYTRVTLLRVARAREDLLAQGLEPFAVDQLAADAEVVHRLLLARGFSADTAVLHVACERSSAEPGRRCLNEIGGLYFELDGKHSGRPCYQKVLLAQGLPETIGCLGFYISWSERGRAWKIGALNDAKAGLAICREDLPDACGLSSPWALYDPLWDSAAAGAAAGA